MFLKKHRIATTVLAGLTMVSFMPMATATVLTFDEFTNGTQINDEYFASYGITIDGYNVDESVGNLAVAFDTSLSGTQDPDLEGPFTNINNASLGTSNPGNVLIIQEDPSACSDDVCTDPDDEGDRPSGYFSIDFGGAVTLNSIDFFDIEFEESASNNAIYLFDEFGNEFNVGDFYTPGTGGDNTWDTLSFDTSDVYSMEIRLNGSGAIDNIDFSYAVPEPTTIALLAFGLLGLSASRRRKS